MNIKTIISSIPTWWRKIGGKIMSKMNELFREKQESESFSRYLAENEPMGHLAPEAELPPDFNAWKDALEADPEYLKKREKELDDELGSDRLI